MNIRHLFSRTLIRRATALALLGAAPMGSALACGMEDYMGSVCVVAFNWCPQNTMPMDGRLLSINQNQALFALIGTTYGGDGQSTFQLPDMRGRVSAGFALTPGSPLPALALGQKDGNNGATLTSANLPSFSATMAGNATGTINLPLANTSITGQSISGEVTVNALNGESANITGGTNIPSSTNNTVGKTGTMTNFYPPGPTKVAVPSSHNLTVSGGTVTGQATGTVSIPLSGTAAVTGANMPVPIIPPRLALNYCIVTQGLYPPRP